MEHNADLGIRGHSREIKAGKQSHISFILSRLSKKCRVEAEIGIREARGQFAGIDNFYPRV